MESVLSDFLMAAQGFVIGFLSTWLQGLIKEGVPFLSPEEKDQTSHLVNEILGIIVPGALAYIYSIYTNFDPGQAGLIVAIAVVSAFWKYKESK